MGIWANIVAGLIAFNIGHMAPLPPLEYNKPLDRPVQIWFTDPLYVHLGCGGSLPTEVQIFACSSIGGDKLIMPDPCLHTEESYARLLCHELGHSKGWPADHPGAVPYSNPSEVPSIPQSSGKTPPK